jgi:hypothetical protein
VCRRVLTHTHICAVINHTHSLWLHVQTHTLHTHIDTCSWRRLRSCSRVYGDACLLARSRSSKPHRHSVKHAHCVLTSTLRRDSASLIILSFHLRRSCDGSPERLQRVLQHHRHLRTNEQHRSRSARKDDRHVLCVPSKHIQNLLPITPPHEHRYHRYLRNETHLHTHTHTHSLIHHTKHTHTHTQTTHETTVIGPTPPGTGVIALATSLTPSKSTSPAMRKPTLLRESTTHARQRNTHHATSGPAAKAVRHACGCVAR